MKLYTFLWILAAILFTVLVIFASLFLVNRFGWVAPLYNDTNGPDDYSLQALTDQDILRGINARTIMSATVTHNDVTTCMAQTMHGVDDLFKTTLDYETRKITVSCKINKGNARLVLVVNDEIVHEFALNQENQHFTLENISGKICLRLAGEDAGYSVAYQWQ